MSDANEIAVLRVELADIEPLIWRRVAVLHEQPADPTPHHPGRHGMARLHLLEFEVDDTLYGVPDPEGAAWGGARQGPQPAQQARVASGGHVVQRASATKLAKLLKDGPITFVYTYDMGDNWEHRILVERLQAAEPGILYPIFLGVSGAARRRIAAAFQATTTFSTPSRDPTRGRAAARSGRC